jgi:hypothetical protein
MSGDTTSSDTTWAHAARSVDKLDMTAEDGAANDRAASDLDGCDLDGRDLDGRALARSADGGCALATRGMTEYVGSAHEATADAKAAAEVTTDALFSLPAAWLLVDRTRSVASAFRSPLLKSPLLKSLLLKSLAALGGAGASFEKVVRSGERCSLYGGSTPR